MQRNDCVSHGLIEALRKGVCGFKKESADVQANIAFLVSVNGTSRREHKDLDGYMSVTYQELYSRFGRSNFDEINKRLGIFEVTSNWSVVNSATKGYRLTPKAADIKDKYLHRSRKGKKALVAMNGKLIRSIPKAVAAKDTGDKTATTAWTSAKVPNLVPVDIRTLQALYDHLKRKRDDIRNIRGNRDLFAADAIEQIEYRCDILAQIMLLALTTSAGEGFIQHRYVESPSGRLYACNINLQTVPRLIKQAALHGLWEYDFENCHYAIFQQMAARYRYDCTAISEYLDNKRETREHITKAGGLKGDQAKVCLLAIMYGARASEWHDNAIPKAIGRAKARLVFADPLFKGIQNDIEQGRRVIIDGWQKGRQDSLKNDFGKSIAYKGPGKKNHKQVLAHLIQGVEAVMLNIAIDLFGGDVLLLQHDGFAARKKLDAGLLKQRILDVTGYEMDLSEERIGIPPGFELTKT